MSNVTRYPQTIASEINSLKEHTRSVLLLSSVEIGKRLIEAKDMLPHGEWGGWLESNVDYSPSTAKNLMQLYNEYGENPQALGDLSYTKAVALIGIEKEERAQFVEENDVENMSSRELQKVIKEKKLLEKEMKEKEESADTERNKLQKSIENLKDQISQAEFDGGGAAELELIESELSHEREKIKRLEADLKAKPIEAAAVEIVPDEIEKELANLRHKVSEQGDPAEVKFKLRFEMLVGEFRNILETLEEIDNPKIRQKYSGAVAGLISKMGESLPQDDAQSVADEEFEKKQVTIFDEIKEEEPTG